MSHANLSRRAILAGAASVPALALPAAVAIAAPAAAPVVKTAAAIEPDPIIGAIAEHRRLDDAQFEMWSELQERDDDAPVSRDEHSRASDAAHKAAWALTEIRPTTAAGATVLFTYACADSSLRHRDEWALPALANAAIGAKQAAHADAELFDLGEKILATAADALLSSRLHDDAEEIIHAWQQQNPAPKTAKALAGWKRRYAAANRACGFDKADAKWSGHCFKLTRLTEEIGDYAVNTADGVEIKKAIIASYKDSHTVGLDYEEKITESIRRDLKHLKRIGAAKAGKAAQS
jgi:hypothetical protein